MATEKKNPKPKKNPTEKAARFRELATKRTRKALKAISVIGNLSNRASYVYTTAEVTRIMGALEDAVQAVHARFNAPPSKADESGFTL